VSAAAEEVIGSLDLADQPRAYREQIAELSDELAETNSGVVALSLEVETYREHLEDLVAQRTAQLETTQEELQQTNSELLMLTSELDSRIAQRTRELTEANAALQQQIEEVSRARAQVRRTAERLELATQSAGLGIWEWNAVTGELMWDDTMFRIYGLAPEASPDLAAARRRTVVAEDLHANDLLATSPLLDQPRFSTQFGIVRPDGVRRIVASSGLVVADADGTLIRAVGIDYDTTERVEAAAELDLYRSQLVELAAHRHRAGEHR
jgi:PAS domain-containing protein